MILQGEVWKAGDILHIPRALFILSRQLLVACIFFLYLTLWKNFNLFVALLLILSIAITFANVAFIPMRLLNSSMRLHHLVWCFSNAICYLWFMDETFWHLNTKSPLKKDHRGSESEIRETGDVSLWDESNSRFYHESPYLFAQVINELAICIQD